jgi:hypothetical protein
VYDGIVVEVTQPMMNVVVTAEGLQHSATVEIDDEHPFVWCMPLRRVECRLVIDGRALTCLVCSVRAAPTQSELMSWIEDRRYVDWLT